MQSGMLDQIFQTLKFSKSFGDELDLSPAQKEQFNKLDLLWSKRNADKSDQI